MILHAAKQDLATGFAVITSRKAAPMVRAGIEQTVNAAGWWVRRPDSEQLTTRRVSEVRHGSVVAIATGQDRVTLGRVCPQ